MLKPLVSGLFFGSTFEVQPRLGVTTGFIDTLVTKFQALEKRKRNGLVGATIIGW